MRHTKEYTAWKNMKARCLHFTGNGSYLRRGITLDPAFTRFEHFFAEVGLCPPDHTLDRINNDGPYAPGNVRWATRTEQARNRSDNNRVTFNGETLTLKEWSERLGLKVPTLCVRLKRWSVHDALTRPLVTPSAVGQLGAARRWQ